MSDKYSERVEATLVPSRLGRSAVALAAIATLALALAMPVEPLPRALAACWVALAALRALRILGPARRLRLDDSGEIEVDSREGRLRAGSFVAPWLTTVRWRPRGGRFDRGVLVLPDMLPAGEFRRLRVLLKAGGNEGQKNVASQFKSSSRSTR